MNNSFDLKRFSQVIALDWRLYLRRFSISMIVWMCLPIVIWITSLVMEFDVDNGARAGFIAAFIFGALITVPSRVYGKANLPREGVGFAMLPATSTEKYLSMILYCSILTPIACGLGGWLIDTLLTLLPFGGFKEFITFPWSNALGKSLVSGIFLFLMVSSYFLFGNMVFKKRKTGKTLAWLLLIHFVIALLIQIPFIWRIIGGFIEKFSNTLASYWVTNAFMFVIATVFYYLTYRRIKNQKY